MSEIWQYVCMYIYLGVYVPIVDIVYIVYVVHIVYIVHILCILCLRVCSPLRRALGYPGKGV